MLQRFSFVKKKTFLVRKTCLLNYSLLHICLVTHENSMFVNLIPVERRCAAMITMFISWLFSLKLSLDEVREKTVVFRVFDWDKFSEPDEIGEVGISNFGPVSLRATSASCIIFLKHDFSAQVQVPLWLLNLSSTTDEWKHLHKFTGTKEKAILKVGLQIEESSA